jgi:hypothetical protein
MPKTCSIVEHRARCPFSGWNQTSYYTGCGVGLPGHWAAVEAAETLGWSSATWKYCPHCGGELPISGEQQPARAEGADDE